MCGIAGIVNKNVVSKDESIQKMVSCITHRGPDEDGFFVDEFVGLGMRRLSIIDLSSGKQPIYSADGKKLIFFNGEIYNYKELREELVATGSFFQTHSDTEVILTMYEKMGEKALLKLRGMFAFVIYNKETHEAFVARDYFGIKPVYYLLDSNKKILAFGSEIKSFSGIPSFKSEVNDNAVFNYLSFQYNPLDETFFKNVYKLAPGSYMKINTETGEYKTEKYWSFEFRKDNTLNEEETKTKILETMQDSVSHHMIADVPVGSFLSGGIDSSIIATLMQKIRVDSKIKTFTVGWNDLTEGIEAKETSNFLNTDHTEITVSSDEYFKALPKAVYHFDEPVADPSAIGLYFVAKEARKHVKVVLSGEGSDELFGGYNIYLAPFARKKLVWIPQSLVNSVVKIFDSLNLKFWGTNYLRRLNMKLEDWYIGNATIFKDGEINKIWKGPSPEKFSLKNLYSNVSNESDSVKMQYIDLNTWLVGDILAKADKMTMANSLELRVPFLDIEVAKLAETLPDKFKWRNGVTKYLLREAFSKVIPETTRNRKKLGFPTPIRNWLTKDRVDLWKTILENEYIKERMDTVYIKQIIDDHTSKKADNARKIYLLLMLALWYDVFIKKNHS
ncbi:MAG: asparagine synthase (glutamine-hydrolyzing) [Patescibacteria group bacterium]